MPNAAETDEWLTRVFSASGRDSLTEAYDQWAESYEADMLAVGYLNPAVAAGHVGRHVGDRGGRILDAGVGTGVMGQIMHVMGYRGLAGVDISEGMLARARARGVYDDLRNRMLGEPLDYADASFAAVVSIGVFTMGHAPAAALDELVRITRPGGHLIMTIATRAWEDGGFRAKLEALESGGRLRLTEVTEPYRPMPLSPTEGALTTRMFAYKAT
jgi:predicted TPR repeat methyltransferase